MLVPVKAFTAAKQRLAPHLAPRQRERLAKYMAARVIAAAGSMPVSVICDDEAVAAWATQQGASVIWTPGRGLNGAVGDAAAHAASTGAERIIVAHADLPFAEDFESRSAHLGARTALLCPDRHGDGTNVMSLPVAGVFDRNPAFVFAYGPGSFAAHSSRCAALGLTVRRLSDAQLEWDIDRVDDLLPPPGVGALPDEFTASLRPFDIGGKES